MKVIVPTPIADATLIDSSAGALIETSVADNSYPAWVSGATYEENQRYEYSGTIYESRHKIRNRTATPDTDPRQWDVVGGAATTDAWVAGDVHAIGERVYYNLTHRVYQAVQETGVGNITPPDRDPEYWLDAGPMNVWAMFDPTTGTRTSGESPLAVTIQPGIVRGLALLGLVGATQVQIDIHDGESLVYSRTEAVGDTQVLLDWYDYYFAEIIPRESFVLSDLPPYGTAAITVTVTGASTVGIGNLIVGPVADFGLTDFGMKLGILDYSLKNKDDFGITGLVERGYASTQDATIFVARDKQDYLFKKLASLRSTLAVYFDDSGYESQIVYGFTRDWDVGVQYPTYIQITISLEGMT